jgi:alkanesulfonate monooxygenase SsuD/methylene tetrahydromethanopterin reductase-like flavin-dependent oxidoreductase (luciferase family)
MGRRQRATINKERPLKLAYFTMPLHPPTRDFVTTLREDREAFLFADELGFTEAFMGEHVTDTVEPVPNSMMFLASIAYETKNIKLGTGTVNLGHHHPAAVAAEAAMLDHMLEGRFLFGVSPGNLPSDAEAFGTLDANRNEMFVEALEHILAIWTTEAPYRLTGKYWNITTEKTLTHEHGQGIIGKPYQKPHPPVIGTVVAPYSKGIVGLGERGWYAISANFLQPVWVATHWPLFEEGCQKVGRIADRQDWRVAKSVFVADDDRVAEEYGKGAQSPYRYYFKTLGGKLERAGMLGLFKTHKDQPDEEVTLDFMVDSLVTAGTVNSVVDQLLVFREQIGDFGTLVYNGPDWVDEQLAKRSMELMAHEVMPRLNEAIGDKAAAE